MAAKARQEAGRTQRKRASGAHRSKEESARWRRRSKAKAKSQKEINRQKLAQARKQDAEKYGDVYTEVTDDDLE